MKVQKVCSFFISESHLLTMLLPYINEKILEERKIVLISQNDMIHDVKKYLKEVKSLKLNKENIIKLDWKKTKNENLNIDTKEKEIIVIGDSKYIKCINNSIEDAIEIVNCHRLENIKEVDEILSNYNIILNTEGTKILNKNSQDAQKRKTIKSQI